MAKNQMMRIPLEPHLQQFVASSAEVLQAVPIRLALWKLLAEKVFSPSALVLVWAHLPE